MKGTNMNNVIEQELLRQAQAHTPQVISGVIAQMADKYNTDSNRLLGLLLKLDFAESHIVTCDPWKHRCGGVPRGSFVIFRIDPKAIDPQDREFCNRFIIARITDAVPTPVEKADQLTLFNVHKLQAQLDPITSKNLQWGALKASVIGTYYDYKDKEGKTHIEFGNDIDTFFAALAYIAYVPTDEDLTVLINAFVNQSRAVEIGWLRYTETKSPRMSSNIPILIDPRDIVGERSAAQRLANFGKTRFGKSNSTKIIARSIFESNLNVAQVFFDPSGEYTYINDQDGTSLFALYHNRSVRYSLTPKPLRSDEESAGLSIPRPLAINFYTNPDVGHSLITSLWSTENDNTPLYMRPILDWEPPDPSNVPRPQDSESVSKYNHYWRTMGMWYAILHRAQFTAPANTRAPIDFPQPIKQHLVNNVTGIVVDDNGVFNTSGQPITVLPAIYREVYKLWQQDRRTLASSQSTSTTSRRRTQTGQPQQVPQTVQTQQSQQGPPAQLNFPPSSSGEPYFNEVESSMLRILGDNSIGGPTYLSPFNKYHSVHGSSIFNEITQHICNGRSVFIDMTQANEVVRNNLIDRLCRSIYKLQNDRFISQEGVGDKFVVMHFEEAHRLFRSDDKDMNSIYNLLAKEGAKLNIAMSYSTQSMTTLSPDLIKNTDNFLIAHLDDDREAREVSRKYAFRDVADDVQRIQSRGYVRMITRSHKFALPVQIHQFGNWPLTNVKTSK
jgi:hypothetical protein